MKGPSGTELLETSLEASIPPTEMAAGTRYPPAATVDPYLWRFSPSGRLRLSTGRLLSAWLSCEDRDRERELL